MNEKRISSIGTGLNKNLKSSMALSYARNNSM
jgi:hypothetical protein